MILIEFYQKANRMSIENIKLYLNYALRMSIVANMPNKDSGYMHYEDSLNCFKKAIECDESLINEEYINLLKEKISSI